MVTLVIWLRKKVILKVVQKANLLNNNKNSQKHSKNKLAVSDKQLRSAVINLFFSFLPLFDRLLQNFPPF